MFAAASIISLVAQCAPTVAPETMSAIVIAESKGDPLRIGVNGGPTLMRQPRTKAEAIATARDLLARGANFDMGLAQINSANLPRLGVSVDQMFDPCQNLAAGARILAENYTRARDGGLHDPLRAAISAYNTGSFTRGFRNGYVSRVEASASAWPLQAGALGPDQVGEILKRSFGGWITQKWRPVNAAYGAAHSFHKVGRAVDFVPRGGMNAISKADIRRMLERSGVSIVELLGPGDEDHSDHFHIAWAARRPGNEAEQSAPVAALPIPAKDDPVALEAEIPPPSWDVFAYVAWKRAQEELAR